jgi:hypothetical protein
MGGIALSPAEVISVVSPFVAGLEQLTVAKATAASIINATIIIYIGFIDLIII